jgi:UDP-3-O-[3-hydroxymyristoyl] N-acetylglucosamine deacetylase
MDQEHYQKTVAKTAECTGVGVHSGQVVHLTVKPAPVNHGIQFVRTDLPDKPCIQARFNKVVDTSLATVIGNDGFIISTIEHLMAAFAGMSVDNALVEINSYEMPIMDGSAGPFIHMLKSAGIDVQDAPRCYFRVRKPIELTEDDKFVGIYPATDFRITCSIDFKHPLIGNQEHSVTISGDNFEQEIADARTFGFYQEQEYMKRYGLGKGASLDNVVVINQDGIMNEGGLRYPNEFVRHKLLDCIGDLSLLGLPILGHIVAKRSGHAFHHAFVKKFFQEKDSWQTKSFDQIAEVSVLTGKRLAS